MLQASLSCSAPATIPFRNRLTLQASAIKPYTQALFCSADLSVLEKHHGLQHYTGTRTHAWYNILQIRPQADQKGGLINIAK